MNAQASGCAAKFKWDKNVGCLSSDSQATLLATTMKLKYNFKVRLHARKIDAENQMCSAQCDARRLVGEISIAGALISLHVILQKGFYSSEHLQ